MENLHSGSRSRGCPAVTLRGFRLVLASTVSGLALSVGMALAQEPAADSATTTDTTDTATGTDAGWSAHGSVTARAGTERHIGELDLFLPLWQNGNSLLYGDLRAQTDDAGNQEGNAGVGFRQMGGEWILGGYGFLDYRKSDETGNSFMQGTLGVEALSDSLDLRTNVYIPGGGEKAAPGAPPVLVMTGSSLQILSGAERALPGVDGEIGYRLWSSGDSGREVRGFAGGYYFDAAGYQTVAGARGRIEARLFDLDFLGEGSRFTLGAEVSQDSVRDTQGFATARLTIPFGGGRRSGQGGLDRRMTDYVVRDVDIITAADADGLVEPVSYAGSGARVGNVTVFSSGDDIAAAAASGGAGDLLIVDGAIDTTATIALQDGQALMSGGLNIEVVGVKTGTRMTYTVGGTRGVINGDVAGAAVVTLASNSIVADIDINNTSLILDSHGVAGNAVTGAAVTGSNITTAGDSGYGVYLIGGSDNIFSGNSITTTGSLWGAGIILESVSNSTISGNSITTAGERGHGIYLDHPVGNLIEGNDITTNGVNGFGLSVTYASNANTFSNNTIVTGADGGFGVYLGRSTTSIFNGNSITTTGTGAVALVVSEASSNDFTGNSFSANGANASAAVLSRSDSNTFSGGNSLASIQTDGLIVENSDNNQFIGTDITAGYGGVRLLDSASNTFDGTAITTGSSGVYGFHLNGAATELNKGTGNSYTGPASACAVDSSVTGTNSIDLCP